MRPIRIFLSVVPIVLAFIFLACSAIRTQETSSYPIELRFDKSWWLKTNSDEQEGFIYGYLDCRQIPNSAKASIVDYRNAVSVSMKSRTTNDRNAVAKEIERAATTLKSRSARGAENYKGPHGFLNGAWWGEYDGQWPSGLADQDRGYLEGFMECASPPVMVQTVHRYQVLLNQHYASGQHEHDNIADVLQQLLKISSNHD